MTDFTVDLQNSTVEETVYHLVKELSCLTVNRCLVDHEIKSLTVNNKCKELVSTTDLQFNQTTICVKDVDSSIEKDVILLLEHIKQFIILKECNFSSNFKFTARVSPDCNWQSLENEKHLQKAFNFINLKKWNDASKLLNQLEPTVGVLTLLAKVKLSTGYPELAIKLLHEASYLSQKDDNNLFRIWKGIIAIEDQYPDIVDVALLSTTLRSILLRNINFKNMIHTQSEDNKTCKERSSSKQSALSLFKDEINSRPNNLNCQNKDIYSFQCKCALRYLYICFDQNQLHDFNCFISYLPDKFTLNESSQLLDRLSRLSLSKNQKLPLYVAEDILTRIVGDEYIENVIELITLKFPEYFHLINLYLLNISSPKKAATVLHKVESKSCHIMLKYECLQFIIKNLPSEIMELNEKCFKIKTQIKYVINCTVLTSVIRFMLTVSDCHKLKILLTLSTTNLIAIMKCSQQQKPIQSPDKLGYKEKNDIEDNNYEVDNYVDRKYLVALENSGDCIMAILLTAIYMVSQGRLDWANKFLIRSRYLINNSKFNESSDLNILWHDVNTIYLISLQRFEHIQPALTSFDTEVISHLLLSSGNLSILENIFNNINSEKLVQLIETKCLFWFSKDKTMFDRYFSDRQLDYYISETNSVLTKRCLAWITVYYNNETSMEIADKALQSYCSSAHELPAVLLSELDLLKAGYILRFNRNHIESALDYLNNCLEIQKNSRLAILFKCKCLSIQERLDEAYSLIVAHSDNDNCKDFDMFIMATAMIYWKLHPNYDSKCMLSLWLSLRRFSNNLTSLSKLHHYCFECIVEMRLRTNSRNLAFNQLSSCPNLSKLVCMATVAEKSRHRNDGGHSSSIDDIFDSCIWCVVRFCQIEQKLNLAKRMLRLIAATITRTYYKDTACNNLSTVKMRSVCSNICKSNINQHTWMSLIVKTYVDIHSQEIFITHGVPFCLNKLDTENVQLLERCWHQLLFADEVNSVLAIDLKRWSCCQQQQRELVRFFYNNNESIDSYQAGLSILLKSTDDDDDTVAPVVAIDDENYNRSSDVRTNRKIKCSVGSKFRKLSFIANTLARDCFNVENNSIDNCDNIKCLHWVIRALRVDPTSFQNWILLSYVCAKCGCTVFAQRAAMCAIRAANNANSLNQIPCSWRIAPVLAWIDLSLIYLMCNKFDSAENLLTEAKLHVPLFTPLCPAWNAALALLKLKEASFTNFSNVDALQILHISRCALRKQIYKFLGQLALRPKSYVVDRLRHSLKHSSFSHQSQTHVFILVALQALTCYLRHYRIKPGSSFSINQPSTFYLLTDYLHSKLQRNQYVAKSKRVDNQCGSNVDTKSADNVSSSFQNKTLENQRILLASALELQGNFRAALKIYSMEFSKHRLDMITAARIRCLVRLGHMKQALQMSKQGGPHVRKEIIICLKRLGKFKEALILAQQEHILQNQHQITKNKSSVNWENVCACLEASVNLVAKPKNNDDFLQSLNAETLSNYLGKIRHTSNIPEGHLMLSNGSKINLVEILSKHLSKKYNECRSLLYNLVFSSCSNQDQLVDSHINIAEYEEKNADKLLSFEVRLTSLNSSISIGHFFSQLEITCLRQIHLCWTFWHQYLYLKKQRSSCREINKTDLSTEKVPLNVVDKQECCYNESGENFYLLDTQISNIAQSLFGQQNVHRNPSQYARLDVHIAHMFPHLYLEKLRQSLHV